MRNLLANDAVRPNCCACYYAAPFVAFGAPAEPAERSAFFCRTYSLVIRVIRGKHVNVLVVCNEPCVIGPLSLVRLIGHSGCPGIGEITEPSPAALPAVCRWRQQHALVRPTGVRAAGQPGRALTRRILHTGGCRILRVNLWAPRPRGRRAADAGSRPPGHCLAAFPGGN